MEVKLKKQPERYMDKCTQSDYEKINNALHKLENLEGNIVKMKRSQNEYRVSIPPFRILFTLDKGNKIITVTKIDSRGDVYKKG